MSNEPTTIPDDSLTTEAGAGKLDRLVETGICVAQQIDTMGQRMDTMEANMATKADFDKINGHMERLVMATPAAAISVEPPAVGLNQGSARTNAVELSEKFTYTWVQIEGQTFAVGSAHCSFRPRARVVEPKGKGKGCMFVSLPKDIVQQKVKSIRIYGKLTQVIRIHKGVGLFPAEHDIIYVEVENPPTIDQENIIQVSGEGSLANYESYAGYISSTAGTSRNSLVTGSRIVASKDDLHGTHFTFPTGVDEHVEPDDSGTVMFLVNRKTVQQEHGARGVPIGCLTGFDVSSRSRKRVNYRRMQVTPFPPLKEMTEHKVFKFKGFDVSISMAGKKYKLDNAISSNYCKWNAVKGEDSCYGVICTGFDCDVIPDFKDSGDQGGDKKIGNLFCRALQIIRRG